MDHFTKIRDVVLDETGWPKQKTTRRCLHPTKSERMFTLWLEGKIIFGDIDDGSDVEDKKNGHEYHENLISCGLWMVHGESKEIFPFKEAKNTITEDGTPIHGLIYNINGVEITEEAFCDTARKSSCYIKYSLKNTNANEVNQKFSLMLRTGKETELICGDGCDQYNDYDPIGDNRINQHPATWKKVDNTYTDGERILTHTSGLEPVWDEKDGSLNYDFTLSPNEEKVLTFILNKGEEVEKDYSLAKKSIEAFWQNEIERLNKLPASWEENPETLKMVRHFTVQMLQCFMYPVGKDYLLFRQGGMRRIVFPGEVCWCFDALSQIGDFSDYLEDTLDTYFNVMQIESGEIVNIGIQWAMVTSVVLYSLAKYCIYSGEKGRECFYKYKAQALKGLEWIKGVRRTTIGDKNLAEGLFPPLRSCDWEEVFQAWLTTDTNIIMGIEAFAETAEYFGDDSAPIFREEYNDYFNAFKNHVQIYVDRSKDSDELYVPLCPNGRDDIFVNAEFPIINHGALGMLGFIGKEGMEKIHTAMIRAGRAYKGLYGGMMHTPMGGLMWYTSAPEYRWFLCWKRYGERAKMQEILDYQLKYCVTEEYIMQERYIETMEYYTPWSPNASAMARTILMMLALTEK